MSAGQNPAQTIGDQIMAIARDSQHPASPDAVRFLAALADPDRILRDHAARREGRREMIEGLLADAQRRGLAAALADAAPPDPEPARVQDGSRAWLAGWQVAGWRERFKPERRE